MTTLMEQVIQLLRRVPEAQQDQLAGEVSELLEEFPMKDELAAIREGEEALSRGDFITLEQWQHEMGLDSK
jgi:hypothetical protein